MTNPKAESDQSIQLKRFKEAARAVGCDESETTFDEKLKKIAQPQGGDAKLEIPPKKE